MLSVTAPPPYPIGRQLLADRGVLVTASAGSGIGFATARRCAEEGARVMLSDIHEERLERFADQLAESLGQPVPRGRCDVRSDTEVRALVAQAEEELDGIDVLVNNAGLGMTRPLLETSAEEWQDLLDVNLSGAFRSMRAALPAMHARGRGAIVNVSSICAWRAEAGQSAYAASKAGLVGLARSLAKEFASRDITVNVVAPGPIATDMLDALDDDQKQAILDVVPAGRLGLPEEVADAIAFLSSDAAGYITGAILPVAGGPSMGA